MSQEFKIKNGLIVSGDATISGAATVNGNSVVHTGNVGSYAVTSLTDTLATVTGRGATTTNAITVGGLTVATNLLYTDTVNGRIGIGTTTPTQRVEVVSFDATIRMGAGFLNSTPAITLINSGASTYKAASLFTGQSYSGFLFDNSGTMRFGSAAKTAFTSNLVANGSETYIMTLVGATSNVLIGTTTDSGYKLDVNGIFRLGLAGGQLYSTAGNTLQANFGNAQFAVGSSGGESIDLSANSTGEIRFGTASTQRMVIKNSGNIGIGTTSPSFKLEVAGSTKVQYLQIQNNGYSGGLPTTPEIYSPASATLAISAGGSERLRIDSSGNVGIGTTNPQSILEVRSAGVGNAGAVITLNRVGNWAASYCGLKLNTNDAGTDWWNVGMLATGTNTFNIGQNGSAMMSILVNGNIGIGTTAPDEKLQVAGNIKIQNETGLITDYGPLVGRYNTSQVYVGTGGNYSIVKIGRADGGALNVLSGGNVGIGTSSPSAKLHVAGNAWINRPSNKVDNAGCTELGPRVEFNNSFSAGQSGYVIFRYPTYNNFLISGDYDGNIGGAIPNIQFGKQSTVYLHMNSSDGNVGIGTTAPDVKLHVSKDYHNYIKIESSVINQQTGLILSNSGVGKSSYVWEDGTRGNYAALKSSTDLLFEAGGGAHYSIFNTSGNFGIGTTTPSYKLHVNGTGYVSSTLTIGSTTNIAAAAWLQFNGSNVLLGEGTHTYLQANGGGSIIFRNNSASTLMTLNNGGNLGINTLNPLEKLHVSGAAIFDGGAGNSSTDSVVYITKSNNNDWGLYVNASGLDYGMYTRVSPSANYAFAIHNGTTWTTRITGNAIVYLGEKNAIEGNSDSWLRLNNSNHYTSGVYTPGVMRADGGFNVNGSAVIHSGTIGSQSVSYANSAGSAGQVTNQTGQLLRFDNRTISPSETTAGYLQFGFTSWANDNSGPYADFLHLRSYTDYTGGDDNLVMFKKSGIGMRIYQQTFGSATAYSSYADVWTTVNFTQSNVNNWNTAYGWGNHASQSYATTSYVTTQINNLINGAPGALDTLSELASALGNDASFATTVTNSIAGKMALYNGAGAPDFNTNTTNGVYRNQGGANGPAGGTHVTMFSAFQPDSNYGWQLASSSSDNLYFRFKDTSFNSWVQIATRSWVTSQNYVTTAGYNNSNWDIAYGWGNHASAGYALNSSLANYLPLSGGVIGGAVTINGNLTVNGTITENSSIKLKENVQTSEGNLEKVVNLRPVTYNKIGSQTTELGLIAEEVAEVYPEFVQYDENGEPVGVHYSRLTAALIGAVKELTQRIETLEKNG